MDITNLSLADLKTALDTKKLSALELTNFYLDRIEKHDGVIKSYLYVAADSAREQAKKYDEMRADNKTVPANAGIPIALKDMVVTKDMPTTCASRMLEGYCSAFDATVVNQLRNAGYIILGKLNMDEFAMGSSGETSYYKKTVNPFDHTKVPGGSSSGSAASVAARLAPVAIGSDTGGSVRQPAAFCGVTGLKPTYGRVSRYGAVGYASSLDTLGSITRTAEDAAFLMDTISAYDPLDPTSYSAAPEFFYKNLNTDMKGVRLGLLKDHAVNDAVLDLYKSMGAEIVEIGMPHADIVMSVYQIIANAEASSAFARFDGVEFGHRADTSDLNKLYSQTRTEAFGYEVKKRIILGTYALQTEQYEKYFTQAAKIRTLVRQDYANAFQKCDLIIGAVSAAPAFGFGGKSDVNDMYTVSSNLNGSCGIAVPCGFTAEGLPLSFQLQGNMYAEQKILNAAYAYQMVTEWHKFMPKGV